MRIIENPCRRARHRAPRGNQITQPAPQQVRAPYSGGIEVAGFPPESRVRQQRQPDDPRPSAWARSRLPTVPVVAAAAAASVGVGGLAVLWFCVATHTGLAAVDPSAVQWFAATRPDWTIRPMSVIADAGQPMVMSALLLLVVAVRAWRHRSAATLMVGVGGLAALLAADVGVKHLAVRVRPPLALHAVPASGFSFPSGHTTISAGAVLLCLWLSRPTDRGVSRRRCVATWFVALVATVFLFAVAASRLVLGVHYPSDVLAGWCTAAAIDGTLLLFIAARAQHPSALGQPTTDHPEHTP